MPEPLDGLLPLGPTGRADAIEVLCRTLPASDPRSARVWMTGIRTRRFTSLTIPRAAVIGKPARHFTPQEQTAAASWPMPGSRTNGKGPGDGLRGVSSCNIRYKVRRCNPKARAAAALFPRQRCSTSPMM